MCGGCGVCDDYRGCYVIGEKFDVKFDVTVFDVTVFNVNSPLHLKRSKPTVILRSSLYSFDICIQK